MLAGPVVLTAILVLLFLRSKYLHWIRPVLIVLILVALGFSTATIRTASLATQFLPDGLAPYLVEGRLLLVEDRLDSARYTVAVTKISGLAFTDMPTRVRLSWRGQRPDLTAGDIIRVRAMLSSPPEPVRPGGYDYARQLYFEKIGGVGYATSPPVTVSSHEAKPALALSIERIRTYLAARISNALSSATPEARAVCVALVTGKRDSIDEDTEQILRDAGLAHLLAISGLHLGLVAGSLFAGTRFLLACNEHLALKYPIKKIAALVALAGAFLYLFISGGAWSTQRAFIMAAVVFVAIILDRRGISLRNVALAALFILILRPEALWQAGFQMSFAAVTVLISAYEWYHRKQFSLSNSAIGGINDRGWFGKSALYFSGLTATSILAGIATAPFGIFHFNRYAAYGLAGNLLAMPVMAVLIMPVAIFAILLIPTGLDWILWRIMAFGVQTVLGVAAFVSAIPGAVTNVAQISTYSFSMMIIGGLILCLFQSPLRMAGGGIIAAGCFLMIWPWRSDMLISRDGGNMAIRLHHGGAEDLVPLSISREKFVKPHCYGPFLVRVSGTVEVLPDVGPPGRRIFRFDDHGGDWSAIRFTSSTGEILPIALWGRNSL